MKGGAIIYWKTVNGIRSGVIIGTNPFGYQVRLEDGKEVIVADSSVQKVVSSATKSFQP